MAVAETQTERRLQVKVQQREEVHANLEELHRELDGGEPNESQKQLITRYRGEMADLDVEIDELDKQVEADREAAKRSQSIRRALRGAQGVDVDEDGVVYRDFRGYLFDVFVTSNVKEVKRIARQWGVQDDTIDAARQRLQMSEVQRTPANTLSSNIGGLTPPQHIAQIMQVIDKSRDLVNAANRVDLERGQLTYPVVTTPPVVAVQATEKTEAGNTGMQIDMVTKTATTYLGGGDLSWQAINWSTPSALRLWFDFVSADYALKTEQDAATVVSASAFLNNIASTLGATPTYVELMAAVGAGGAEVYANSGRMANAVIMAPDRYWYVMGLATDSPFGFGGGSGGISLGADRPALRVLASRGLNAGEIIVGDLEALLVAETPGAPVEMQVVEPAIGGVEVGLIGAFEAAVTDDGAFALITTAS